MSFVNSGSEILMLMWLPPSSLELEYLDIEKLHAQSLDVK
jgi:hypothetical protein